MGFDSECAKFSLLTKICRPKFYAGEMITPVYELETLKPLQNKKGQKNLRYLTKKQSSNFFGPSYFEMALIRI